MAGRATPSESSIRRECRHFLRERLHCSTARHAAVVARAGIEHPDKQVTWVSENGKTIRGTVRFEPLGADRTLVRLSMSYRPEGLRERVGSAAGLDARRVRGDLQRFKEMIEGRGDETGAWRGEVSSGTSN